MENGGQRGIMSYFSHAPHRRLARDAQRRPTMGQLRLLDGSFVTSGHDRSADGNGGYG